MKAFWAFGYEGTSVDRLCRLTNMPRASLYHDFKDKEGLFLAAVAHYAKTRLAPLTDALGPRGPLSEDLAAFYESVVHLGTSDPETPGCLISSVLADVAATNATFRAELDGRFSALETLIADRLRMDGWPEDATNPPEVVAGLVAAIARGIIQRARSGQSADILQPVGTAGARAVLTLDPRSGA